MDTEQKSLFQLLSEVHNEETFISFIDALKRDRIDSVDEWQNDTIELFLECSHEWAKVSIYGLPSYKKPENSWKRCVDILYMSKIYE